MIKRVAVVNRGEAALRFLQSARVAEPPIESVLLYTRDDQESAAVRRYPERVLMPGGKEAYDQAERVIRAARDAGCDSAWLGWGFSSERASFVAALEEAGLVLLAPRAETLERLGDKGRALEVAEAIGLDVGGGVLIEGDDSKRLAESIHRAVTDHALDFPLLLKATEGGGGRGIWALEDATEVAQVSSSAVDLIARGALSPRFLLEPLLRGALHIEAQILGDGEGAIEVMGLRDCSVQRRRQKMIEECPPPRLPPEIGQQITEAAYALAKSVNYRSAGTVEMLYHPPSNRLRFLEVNPRLQVEHPVTEMVYGVDLVSAQINIARGLGLPQATPPKGVAIEARVYAEDPQRDFSPSPGILRRYRPPFGPHVRVDTGFEEGDTISEAFDPLIAKVIAWGADRRVALTRLTVALEDCQILIEGGSSNHRYLSKLLRHEIYRAGAWTIHDTFPAPRPSKRGGDLAIIASALDCFLQRGDLNPEDRGRHRLEGEVALWVYRLGPQTFYVSDCERSKDSIASVDGAVVEYRMIDAYTRQLKIDSSLHTVQRVLGDLRYWVNGAPYQLTPSREGPILAPSMGVVLAYERLVGDHVKRGDRLLLLESMKVELSVDSPRAGVIQAIYPHIGEIVRPGQPLVLIDGNEPSERKVPRSIRWPDTWDTSSWTHALTSALTGWDLSPFLTTLTQEALKRIDAQDRAQLLISFLNLAELFDRRARRTSEDRSGSALVAQPLLLLETLSRRGADALPERWRALLGDVLLHFKVKDLKPSQELSEALIRLQRVSEHLASLAHLAHQVLESLDPLPLKLLDRIAGLDPDRFGRLVETADERALSRFKPYRDQVLNAHTLEATLSNMLRSAHEVGVTKALMKLKVNSDTLISQVAAQALDQRERRSEACQLLFMLLGAYEGALSSPKSSIFIEGVDALIISSSEGIIFISRRRDQAQMLVDMSLSLQPAINGMRSIVWLCLDTYGIRDDHGRLTLPLLSALNDLYLDIEQADLSRLTGAEVPPPLSSIRPSLTLIGFKEGRLQSERLETLSTPPAPRRSVAFNWNPLVTDLSPRTIERIRFERFERFHIERIHQRERLDVALYRLVAKENPEDVRLFVYGEVTHLRRRRGRPLHIPQVDHIFYEAIRALHRTLKELDPDRRLHWNRLVIRIVPVVPLGVEIIKHYVSRLNPATRWVGLEKLIVQARFADPRAPEGVSPLMDLSIYNLLQQQQGYAVRPTSAQPLTPRTLFESRVVTARRRGLIHPAEVINLLEGVGPIQRGRFTRYALTSAGTLIPAQEGETGEDEERLTEEWRSIEGMKWAERGAKHVTKAHGEERPSLKEAPIDPASPTASVIIGVIETPLYRPRITLKRVLILSDPTRHMGALAQIECDLIYAAFDLASELDIPVEWVSVSGGAKIDWETGTENLDACAMVLKRIIRFTKAGGMINVIVPGICVGAQSYWNAEATMMSHCKGALIMTDQGAMVLTGKRALEFSGCVSAEDELGLGGYSSVMGPNGQAQLYAPDLPSAYRLLYQFYQLCYLEPQQTRPPRLKTKDRPDRDVGDAPYPQELEHGFSTLREIFSTKNIERKRPFSIRPVMTALLDKDAPTLERWGALQGGETAVVWHGRLDGYSVTLIGIENQPMKRVGVVQEGPQQWAGGTLYPQASRKVARAIRASQSRCPVIVLANLSGFDGSPESLRQWQLEYGAEIAQAVEGFDAPIYFVVLSRYHGGAYVVFSKSLNPRIEAIALKGSYASVIGGAPAAAVIFGREVKRLTDLYGGGDEAHAQALNEVAHRFDQVHDIHRALDVGSIDTLLEVGELRSALAHRLALDASSADQLVD